MSILTTTVKGWFEHRIQLLAAAFTFYALLSLGPLLVISLTIACHILDSDTAISQAIQHIAYYVGDDSALTIRKIIDGAVTARHKIMTTGIGILLLYLSASAVFSSLHEALNSIWEIPSGKRSTFFTFFRKQVITVLLVILIVALFLLSLITSTVLASLSSAIHEKVIIPVVFVNIMDFMISIIIFSGLFAFIFKIVPDTPIQWREVRAGALVTSVLFNISKFFISRFLGHSEIFLAYGSLASFILIVVLVYISAQIVLLGAEFTRAHIRHMHLSGKKNVRSHNRNVIVKTTR